MSTIIQRGAGPRLAPALTALALVVAASALGWLATEPNLSWYDGLAKPSFNPPNAIFGPVWTTLYLLMAFAFWRILRLPRETSGRASAIWLFLAQLTLNAAWSFLFFAGRNPLAGLVEIVPQWALVIATMLAFFRLDPAAGWALAPLAL